MRYLEIRSLGPVTRTELMKITSVTVFCGRQGSGKSTIVKVLSSCIWLEKSIIKQEVSEKYYTQDERFRNKLCAYHQIEDFFLSDTYIKYVGEAYTFEYKEERLYISKSRSDAEYLLPKLMYIPAERNFMVAIEQADKVRNLPPSLVTLQEEYLKALGSIKETFPLLDGFAIEYNKQNKIAYIVKNLSKVRAHKGASGLQSLLPLLLVSHHLSTNILDAPPTTLSADELATLRKKIARIQEDSSLSDHLKKIMIEDLSKVITPRCMWCIVEEPEQNLYPLSQRETLLALLRDRQCNRGSGLVMTTHSPYIINYLSVCVKAYQVAHDATDDVIAKVEKIIPQDSLLAPQDLSIYEIDEEGSVQKLETYDGIPTDSNFLNKALAETNDLYGDLMDIEDDASRRG
ncbi:hypothetical protein [uncultured Porphyromonas sp.]|uniref:hypothetical protein n=1 Tax=uncultured Porphyromonas sp. TaxID=159274 RepID=UPI00260826AC|nr:hypothetical protein [uncultured Porphyromonas sp.]